MANRNHGWAINAKAPADGVFIFDKSYAINHVDLYSKYVDGAHEINDFDIYYSTVASPSMPIDADEWKPMTSVSFAEPAKDGKIVGNKVTLAGQDLLRLGFATAQATAIRLHVRGSNTYNNNIVLTEIIAFDMATAPPTGAPTAFPTAAPTKVPTYAPTSYKHCGANCGMAGFHPWPTDDHAASLPWNTPTRTNMYCAGTCNRCGTGCSCGTSDSGVLRHMYVKNAAGQQKMSGYRSCPPGTHQPENKCVNGVAACVPI